MDDYDTFPRNSAKRIFDIGYSGKSINRLSERGGGRCLPTFLGKGGSVEKFMQVILQSNSVELSGVGQ